jgi:hypothetical protein
LAVANQADHRISVRLNLGNGAFGAEHTFGTSQFPYSVAIGDLDGDGFPDIAAACEGGDQISILRNCTLTGTYFCAGDGSAAPCPCGNASSPNDREGCLSSIGTGGKLQAFGSASVSQDTLVLAGSRMTDSSALYFQGTQQVLGGTGVALGDGLHCAGGTVIRLGATQNSSGASQFPFPGGVAVSVGGQVPAGGVTRTYQVWYRNAASFCTASTFNLTNGWAVTWTN